MSGRFREWKVENCPFGNSLGLTLDKLIIEGKAPHFRYGMAGDHPSRGWLTGLDHKQAHRGFRLHQSGSLFGLARLQTLRKTEVRRFALNGSEMEIISISHIHQRPFNDEYSNYLSSAS